MFAYIALVGESQEPDANIISAVFTAMVNRRWARKTKAEKLATGLALTAARMKKQRKAKSRPVRPAINAANLEHYVEVVAQAAKRAKKAKGKKR